MQGWLQPELTGVVFREAGGVDWEARSTACREARPVKPVASFLMGGDLIGRSVTCSCPMERPLGREACNLHILFQIIFLLCRSNLAFPPLLTLGFYCGLNLGGERRL